LGQIKVVVLVLDGWLMAHDPLYRFKAFDCFNDRAVANGPSPNRITGVVKIGVEDIIFVRIDRV